MTPSPGMTNQQPGGRLITLDYFLCGKGNTLSLSCSGFSFLTCNGCAQTTITELKNVSNHCQYFTVHCFWSRNSLLRGQQWAHAHGIHWFYYVLHHPNGSSLLEGWKNLFNTQLQCQFGGSILENWNRVLQKALYVMNQYPHIPLFPHTQGSWIWESMNRKGDGSSYYHP